VVTKEARRTVPLAPFMGFTMGAGAIMLLPLILILGGPVVDYPAASWAWLAALVLITTVGGHGAMNAVAPHVSLFTLYIVSVLGPPLGVLLGVPLVGATVTAPQAIGGAILAVAVVVGLMPRRAEINPEVAVEPG